MLAQAQAPRQDVEELRSQLLQAVAHTQALEAQVQQMKLALQAAATAQQHKVSRMWLARPATPLPCCCTPPSLTLSC